MATFQQLVQSLVDRFRHFDPSIHVQFYNGKAIIRINASKLFRALYSPMFVTIMDEGLVTELIKKDITSLKTSVISDLPHEERTRISPLLIFDSEGSTIVQKVRKILDSPFPVFSAKMFMKAQLSIPSLRTYFTDYASGALLRYLNPYRIDIITPHSMFYGRDKTLDELVKTYGNKFIIGARRIGKSSLATMLKKKLGRVELPKEFMTRNEPKSINRCSYVDVSRIGTDDSSQIWYHILKEFGLSRSDYFIGGRVLRFSTSRQEINNPEYNEYRALDFLLTRMPSKEGLTIILDEVDNWLYYDRLRNWQTLDQLRAISDNGKANVILVGYETLATLTEDHKFPLHSRGGGKSKILLTPIDRPSVEKLVFEPMQELGIQIENKVSFIDKVWHVSAGMPNIVQDLCYSMVNQMEETNGKNRILNISNLDHAIDNSSAIRNLVGSVLESGFPLAKLISGISSLYTKSPNNEDFDLIDKMSDIDRALKSNPVFTINTIINRIKNHGYEYDEVEFNLALAHLELRLILKPANESRTQWYWNTSSVRKIVAERIIGVEFENWVKNLIELHKKGAWRKEYVELGYLK